MPISVFKKNAQKYNTVVLQTTLLKQRGRTSLSVTRTVGSHSPFAIGHRTLIEVGFANRLPKIGGNNGQTFKVYVYKCNLQ